MSTGHIFTRIYHQFVRFIYFLDIFIPTGGDVGRVNDELSSDITSSQNIAG